MEVERKNMDDGYEELLEEYIAELEGYVEELEDDIVYLQAQPVIYHKRYQ